MTDLAPHGRGRRRQDVLAHDFAVRYLQALRAGDARAAASAATGAVDAGLPVPAVHTRVMAPAMVEIGRLWERGDIDVADEHLATAISHQVLSELFGPLLTRELATRERVVIAAVEGESHVLGARMAADVLEGAGFDVLYLGADIPTDTLLQFCRDRRPAVVGLSASTAALLPALLRTLDEVHRLPAPPLLMVGGAALEPRVRAGLRIPVVDSSEEVTKVVEGLLAGPPQEAPVSPELDQALEEYVPQAPRRVPEGVRSVQRAMSETVMAAAEATRRSAREAYAYRTLASHDQLTGLWNRGAFADECARLADAGAADHSLLVIDLDDFKTVNDTRGHPAGDQALLLAARAIHDALRPSDFAARVGGDEFVALLTDASLPQAEMVAERICRNVERTVIDPPVTCSIGVAPFRGNRRSAELVADRALYRAKAGGRGTVVVGEDDEPRLGDRLAGG